MTSHDESCESPVLHRLISSCDAFRELALKIIESESSLITL